MTVTWSDCHSPSRVTHDEGLDVRPMSDYGLRKVSRPLITVRMFQPLRYLCRPSKTSEVPALPPVPSTGHDFVTNRSRDPFSSPVTDPIMVVAISPVSLVDGIWQRTRSRLAAASFDVSAWHPRTLVSTPTPSRNWGAPTSDRTAKGTFFTTQPSPSASLDTDGQIAAQPVVAAGPDPEAHAATGPLATQVVGRPDASLGPV